MLAKQLAGCPANAAAQAVLLRCCRGRSLNSRQSCCIACWAPLLLLLLFCLLVIVPAVIAATFSSGCRCCGASCRDAWPCLPMLPLQLHGLPCTQHRLALACRQPAVTTAAIRPPPASVVLPSSASIGKLQRLVVALLPGVDMPTSRLVVPACVQGGKAMQSTADVEHPAVVAVAKRRVGTRQCVSHPSCKSGAATA